MLKGFRELRRYSMFFEKKFEPCATKHKILKEIITPSKEINDKITVVGLGSVGVATAFNILSKNISRNVAIIEVNKNLLRGEAMDLQLGSYFMKSSNVQASTDFAVSENSKICIVTAGVRQQPHESRLDLLHRNVSVLQKILPQLVKYSPNTIILMATNPVDVLTYVAWKISGLAANKVIGSGTNLDTSRFKYWLSQKFGVAAHSCHGYIVGEHGNSSIALWSSVNVAGVRLRDINPQAGIAGDKENWASIHKKVIRSAYEVQKYKGYTSWAIALSLGSITKCLLENAKYFHPVTVKINGLHGIEDEVFLSLPCILNKNGISQVLKTCLDGDEMKLLRRSADILLEMQLKSQV